MNLRDMLNMVRGGQDDRICVIKGTVSINDEGINKILYDGKYWIRVKGTGEIIPPIPEELMNAEAGMGLGTEADYLILAPDFDVDAYWNTVKTNPPYFRRKTYDISCEKIIELDKANVSLVEDFKAMAASHNLTVKELMGYLTEKL
jgi:hypothetical protein